MRKAIYVIMVTPEASCSKVNREAYNTFEEAVDFILSRPKNPQYISGARYRDEDYTEYEIFEVIA